MSGDLLEILFIAAFILFGLLGGRKKKRPQQPASRPRQRPQPRERTATARPRQGATEQDRLLRELEGLLTGRPASMQDLPDPDEARSLETLEVEESSTWEEGLERAGEVSPTSLWKAGRDRASVSLETLEEAGGASHERFHALYDRPAQAPPTSRTARPTFRTADMRRAVIWSEILGPPVSER